ncbi:hypothetical protein D3C72_626370 [compost metagenome]
MALVPPLVMGAVCWIYHEYPLFDPSLTSFMFRFYFVCLFGYMTARCGRHTLRPGLARLNVAFIVGLTVLASVTMEPDPAGRLAFLDISTTSAHAFAVLALFLYLSINPARSHAPSRKLFFGVMCLAFTYLCIMTQSRGGFLSLLLVTILAMFHSSVSTMRLFNRTSKQLLIILPLLALVSYLTSLNWFELGESVFSSVTSVLGRDFSGYSNELRTGIWESYAAAFAADPNFLWFGDGFPRQHGDTSTYVMPTIINAAHNYAFGSIGLGGLAYFIPLAFVITYVISKGISKLPHLQAVDGEGSPIYFHFLVYGSLSTFALMAVTDNFPYLFSAWPVHAVFGLLFFAAGISIDNDIVVHRP